MKVMKVVKRMKEGFSFTPSLHVLQCLHDLHFTGNNVTNTSVFVSRYVFAAA